MSNSEKDDVDEYDVDYDNLVVSDILGTSGLPVLGGGGYVPLGSAAG